MWKMTPDDLIPTMYICTLLLLLTFPQGTSTPVTVSVAVGDPATLPCRGVAGIPDHDLRIRWQVYPRRVWDFSKGKTSSGDGYKERAEAPREKIRQGDFSLTIDPTRVSDEGLYECYYQGKDFHEMKFLSNVRLILKVRTENRSAVSGGDLSVPVFDDEVVVLFNNTVVYPRSSDTQHEHVSVQNGSLIIHRVTQADQGSYTVRDKRMNRTISVITVTVTAPENWEASENQGDSTGKHRGSDQGDRSTGVIAGVLGAAVGLTAAGVGIWWCRRRRT